MRSDRDRGVESITAGSGFVTRPKPAHRCSEPEAKRFDVGDVFTCMCGRRFVLVDAQQYQGGPFWSSQTGSPAPSGENGGPDRA